MKVDGGVCVFARGWQKKRSSDSRRLGVGVKPRDVPLGVKIASTAIGCTRTSLTHCSFESLSQRVSLGGAMQYPYFGSRICLIADSEHRILSFWRRTTIYLRT
jgi:hypothetical protein